MSKIKYISNSVSLYILLWCVYSLQGVLYASGSIISRGVLLAIILWSLVIVYKANTLSVKKPYFIKSLNVFLIFTSIYGVLLIISGRDLYITEGMMAKVPNIEYLKNIYISLLPFYAFYYYTIKGKLTEKHMLIFSICLLLVCTLNFYHSQAEAIILAAQRGIDRDGFTLNVGYDFLAIMPVLIFWNRRPLIQFILLLFSIVYVILSMKRGAILIGSICFIYFLYSMFQNSRGSTRWGVIILSVLAISFSAYLVSDLFQSNDYFVSRIEQTLEGDSSNRDELYSTYFNHFIRERSFLKFIFGNGANATLTIGYNYAHNDWLEIAINNGLLGILIYLSYFLSLFRDYLKVRSYNQVLAGGVLMVLLIMFTSSLFSMSYASLNIAIPLVIGFVLAKTYIKS